MDKDIMEGKYKDNPVTQELIKNNIHFILPNLENQKSDVRSRISSNFFEEIT